MFVLLIVHNKNVNSVGILAVMDVYIVWWKKKRKKFIFVQCRCVFPTYCQSTGKSAFNSYDWLATKVLILMDTFLLQPFVCIRDAFRSGLVCVYDTCNSQAEDEHCGQKQLSGLLGLGGSRGSQQLISSFSGQVNCYLRNLCLFIQKHRQWGGEGEVGGLR